MFDTIEKIEEDIKAHLTGLAILDKIKPQAITALCSHIQQEYGTFGNYLTKRRVALYGHIEQ